MVDDDEDWVNQHVPITPWLANALKVATRGGGARRYLIADSLAEQLGFEEPLGVAGIRILLSLLPNLEEVLLGDPDDWVSGVDLPRRVALGAVGDLDEAGLVTALVELGWSRLSPPLTVRDAAELRDALAGALTERLSTGLRVMLDAWRNRGLWIADPRRPPPRAESSS